MPNNKNVTSSRFSFVHVFQMVFNKFVAKECGRNNVIFRETSFFSFPTVKENEIELLKKRRSIWIHLENHVYSLTNVNTIFEMKISIHKNIRNQNKFGTIAYLTCKMELFKFLFLFRQKLKSTLKVKYESFTWGRYAQRCTARWLVRSTFVKQQGYALCTSTIH